MNQKFLIQEAVKYGWEAMKKHFWFFAGMLAIFYALMYGLPFLGQYFIKQALNNNPFFNGIFSLIINILGIIISIGLVKVSLNIYDDKSVDYEILFTQWKFFWRYLGSMILYGLIVLGGFILLIVPGIIWSIKYSMTPYLILEGYGPLDALTRSGVITKGVKGKLFLLWLLLVLISLAGYVLFFIGSFVAQPIVLLAGIFVYKKLQNAIPKEPVLPQFIN